MNTALDVSPRKHKGDTVKPQIRASLNQHDIARTEIALKCFKCLKHVASCFDDCRMRHPCCRCTRAAGMIDLATTDKNSA
jgi:hypothetical protein